jgi:tetratricopeptide (TPR) repeat protein
MSYLEIFLVQDIRRNVCTKLAEVLMHGISDVKYTRPEQDASPKRPTLPPLHRGNATISTLDSPWKPRKHGGSNLFTPRNKHEEVILLLTLSEYMARKEAILSQAPEFFGMRSTKFRDAIISYDLTAIALSRVRSFRLLVDMLQHSMKFSFNEPHTWTQYGLALSTEGKNLRSLMVFRELSEKNQVSAGASLCTARLCYEKLHMYEEGLLWSQRALKKDDSSSDHFLRARCNLYIGIGCMLKYKGVENHEERMKLLATTEEHFLAANKADPGDHLSEFYLAFHYAHSRNISKATQHVRQALVLQPEHLSSLHLMTLLLTARGEALAEALEVVDQTIDEFPDNLSIIALKVRMEEAVNGGEAAILTAKGMLEQWQTVCEQIMQGGGDDFQDMSTSYNTINPVSALAAGSYDHLNGYSRSSGLPAGAGSVPAFDTLSDKDSVSLHAHSVTASHVEKTLSEVASSLSAPFPRPGPHDPAYTQMRIWLMTAELHLRQGNVSDAELCAGEARQLAPLSYHLMHLRGQIYEARDELEAAKTCYENSLSINPTHVSSLHRLGWVNHLLGFDRLAEQSLKVAVRIDPHNEEIWSLLGEIKEGIASDLLEQTAEEMDQPAFRKEETERTPTDATSKTLLDEATRMFRRASECHAIALSLQASSPILPFTTISLCFE